MGQEWDTIVEFIRWAAVQISWDTLNFQSIIEGLCFPGDDDDDSNEDAR